MSYPKEKRRFDHGGFVVFVRPKGPNYEVVEPRIRWRCPNCGGDCFGTSSGVRYCSGHSFGSTTEQSVACGYWEDDLGNRGVR
jgi:hypothetical protein